MLLSTRENKVINIAKARGLTIFQPFILKKKEYRVNCYDQEGYRYYISYNNILNIKKFDRFSKTNPYTIENIKLWLKSNAVEYELLSDTYINTESKLVFKLKTRPDLDPCEISWHSFSSGGVRHYKIAEETRGDGRRHSPENVRAIVENILKTEYKNEWTLNENEEYLYRVQDTHLKFTHKEGYIGKTSLALLNEAKSKVERNKSLEFFNVRFPEESMFNLKHWIKLYTPYEVKENQKYTKFKAKYIFICKIHGEFEKAFHSMYSYNTQCFQCYCDSITGRGNPMYNENLTEEDRKEKRNTFEYTDWRSEVYRRDKYTCKCCGNKQTLVAHHLNGWHWAKDQRVDIDNGITLCANCHIEFHTTYGYSYSTVEQFMDFLKYKQGNVG